MVLSTTVCLFLLALSSLGEELPSCVIDIAERYFTDQYIIFTRWAKAEKAVRSLLQDSSGATTENVILKALQRSVRWTLTVCEAPFPEESNIHVNHKTSNVIFFMSGERDLDDLVNDIRVNKKRFKWRNQGRLLIVVMGEDGMEKARTFLQALWKFRKASNAAVVVAGDRKTLNIYKWYPYVDDCNGVNRVRMIDEWKEGRFIRRSKLFEDGITDVNGCGLTIGAFPNPPYVLDPIGDRINFTRGLDIKIFNMLSEYYNFTIRYVTLPDGMFPYIIYDANGKASGFHEMLQQQKIDIMVFGCRVHELRNTLGDPIDSYTEDALVWVVPSPGLVPSWRNLGDAFSPTVWLLFGVFFVLISITLYTLANNQMGVTEHHTLQSYINCLLSTLSIHLNISVARPLGTHLRIFMAIFSLFAINATSAYQSSLIALLTGKRYERPYETPMDAVQAGVKTYLFPSGNITYNQTDHSMWEIILQPGRHEYSENFVPVIREIAVDKNAMVLMAQKVAGYEIKTKYTWQDIPGAIFLKEKFSLYKVTAYLSLGHPLREQFRRKVNQMVEGGFVDYWLEELFVMSKHSFTNIHASDEAQPLTLSHLQGLFFILIIALLASTQVFCAELLFGKIFIVKFTQNRNHL